MSDYRTEDIAIIIPTKDRPEIIKNLLDSIVSQTIKCGQVVIVDGGDSIEKIVTKYEDELPVQYYECNPPGQIRQRNLAIKKLKSNIKLVALLDDDLVLSHDALEQMINYWNTVDYNTAGISFNITNNPPYKHKWYKAIVGMSSKKMGTILPSGYNVPISPVSKSIKTQWLCGGATVWKKSILENNLNHEIQSRWAICEDITFSYPIGLELPMYVCSTAKVRHEHVYDHNKEVDHIYYGRTATLWRLHFVMSNKSLSKTRFFYMVFAQIIARFAHGFILFRKDSILYSLGQVYGCMIGISIIIKKQNIISVLNELS